MEILVDNHKQILPESLRIESLTQLVLKKLNCNDNTEVSIVFVSDEEIHELNRTYRGVDRPTDVLSFCQREGDEGFDFEDTEEEAEILGDIIISVPTAERQAREAGKTTEAEISMLIVHGLLHLLGYDHAEPDEEREMFSLQNELLNDFLC